MLKKPKLILHFDVNKTIFMADPVAKKDTEDILNSVICDTAWGFVDENGWKLGSLDLSYQQPKEGMQTYYTYVKSLGLKKMEREKLVKVFTSPNQPGEKFYDKFLELKSHMVLPNSNELVGIVPSFFELVIWLVENRDFSLCFRTMGSDIPFVIQSFNEFCRGQNPLFPSVRFDGSDPIKPNLIMAENQVGSFHRWGVENQDTCLILGSCMSHESSMYKSLEQCEQHCQNFSHCSHHHAFENIDRCLKDVLNKHNIFAIRDDYLFWAKSKENYQSGKLLLVDPDDLSEHHIFFDDNIWMHEFEKANQLIVDLRHKHLGHSLNPKSHLGLFLVQSQPLYAISNRKYFIEQVLICEKNRNQ